MKINENGEIKGLSSVFVILLHKSNDVSRGTTKANEAQDRAICPTQSVR
jgi:hypothetical protein